MFFHVQTFVIIVIASILVARAIPAEERVADPSPKDLLNDVALAAAEQTSPEAWEVHGNGQHHPTTHVQLDTSLKFTVEQATVGHMREGVFETTEPATEDDQSYDWTESCFDCGDNQAATQSPYHDGDFLFLFLFTGGGQPLFFLLLALPELVAVFAVVFVVCVVVSTTRVGDAIKEKASLTHNNSNRDGDGDGGLVVEDWCSVALERTLVREERCGEDGGLVLGEEDGFVSILDATSVLETIEEAVEEEEEDHEAEAVGPLVAQVLWSQEQDRIKSAELSKARLHQLREERRKWKIFLQKIKMVLARKRMDAAIAEGMEIERLREIAEAKQAHSSVLETVEEAEDEDKDHEARRTELPMALPCQSPEERRKWEAFLAERLLATKKKRDVSNAACMEIERLRKIAEEKQARGSVLDTVEEAEVEDKDHEARRTELSKACPCQSPEERRKWEAFLAERVFATKKKRDASIAACMEIERLRKIAEEKQARGSVEQLPETAQAEQPNVRGLSSGTATIVEVVNDAEEEDDIVAVDSVGGEDVSVEVEQQEEPRRVRFAEEPNNLSQVQELPVASVEWRLTNSLWFRLCSRSNGCNDPMHLTQELQLLSYAQERNSSEGYADALACLFARLLRSGSKYYPCMKAYLEDRFHACQDPLFDHSKEALGVVLEAYHKHQKHPLDCACREELFHGLHSLFEKAMEATSGGGGGSKEADGSLMPCIPKFPANFFVNMVRKTVEDKEKQLRLATLERYKQQWNAAKVGVVEETRKNLELNKQEQLAEIGVKYDFPRARLYSPLETIRQENDVGEDGFVSILDGDSVLETIVEEDTVALAMEAWEDGKAEEEEDEPSDVPSTVPASPRRRNGKRTTPSGFGTSSFKRRRLTDAVTTFTEEGVQQQRNYLPFPRFPLVEASFIATMARITAEYREHQRMLLPQEHDKETEHRSTDVSPKDAAERVVSSGNSSHIQKFPANFFANMVRSTAENEKNDDKNDTETENGSVKRRRIALEDETEVRKTTASGATEDFQWGITVENDVGVEQQDEDGRQQENDVGEDGFVSILDGDSVLETIVEEDTVALAMEARADGKADVVDRIRLFVEGWKHDDLTWVFWRSNDVRLWGLDLVLGTIAEEDEVGSREDGLGSFDDGTAVDAAEPWVEEEDLAMDLPVEDILDGDSGGDGDEGNIHLAPRRSSRIAARPPVEYYSNNRTGRGGVVTHRVARGRSRVYLHRAAKEGEKTY